MGDVLPMKLIYGVNEKLPLKKNLVFAFQQMIAIMAATLLVPIIVSGTEINWKVGDLTYVSKLYCDPAAAFFGAGAGTIVYLLFTKFKSPVFLGSSFTFLGALCAAATSNFGYWGLIIGVGFAGLVYVVIAIIIKLVGSGWIKKLLPHVIIGPVLAIIGLSLSGTAGSWMMNNGGDNYSLWHVVVGLFTFIAIVLASVKGGKSVKLIPFIVGIGAGFVLALIITAIGYMGDSEFLVGMRLVDFKPIKECFSPIRFESFLSLPKFTFLEAFRTKELEYHVYDKAGEIVKTIPALTRKFVLDGAAIGNLALLFVPIAVVELAQHISDHENLSNIVESDLLEDPGLHRTLLGDGVGSMVGAFFGGSANTTYGESISCVAISKDASTSTIFLTGIMCMVVSCISPFAAIINMMPKCVMGGACIAMYGFISVSGLQMLKDVDLSDNRNLYPVAAILVLGIGGVTFNFGTNPLTNGPLFQLTSLAVAMLVGIITNYVTHSGKDKDDSDLADESAAATSADDNK